MPRVISIVIFLVGTLNLHAQNLVPNPSFEDFTSCPNDFGMGGPLLAAPWQNGSGTTADYFNACSGNAFVDVPPNYFGWQQAHTGSGYAGGYHYHAFTLWLEYLQVQLLSPMVAGQFYHVSMYTNRSNYNCAIASIGLYISDTPPPTNGADALLVNPQVVNTGGFLSDTLNWTLIEGYYMAQGGEQWITIGNFEENASTLVEPCGQIPEQAYYYYDDVSIVTAVPCDILDVDLGDDIDVCFEYTIDPDLGDYQYVWSNGSTDPTITVYESGIYGLTITDSCSVGFDQIEVNILGITPVELGPDSAMICAGESYEIVLDDEFGEYTWNDGSTDPSYTIESSGIYSVTFDDGCAVSADTIVIDVLDPPALFSLGPDTLLCDDNVYVISFEESLGDFEWSDGSNESTYTIEEEGEYALTISNVCGEESDDIDVVYGVSPYVELGPDQVFICSGDIISFDLDEEEGSYLWQDSTTSPYYEITLPGLYSVTVTNGCGSYDDQLIVQLTPAPDVDLGEDQVICPAQLPDTLDVSSSGATSVVWNDGSTSLQYILTTSGTYSVTVTNACGTGADTIQVAVADILPSVILPNDMVLCEGDSAWLFNTGDDGNNLWQDGSIHDSLLVQSAGTYTLAVTTVCGTGYDSVEVSLAPNLLFPNLGPDFALCPGETGTLHAGVSFNTYLWQDMSTADSLVISSPGVYSVMVADDCGIGTDTVIITLSNSPPQVDLADSVYLCTGQQVTLDAGISGVGFVWSDGSMLSTLAVNTPGVYSLTVSNNCGVDVDSVIVIDGGSVPAVNLGSDIQLCEGGSQIIMPVFTNADSWTWQDGTSGPNFNVTTSGEISIEAVNTCGSAFDTLIAVSLTPPPSLNLGNDTALCESAMMSLTVNIPDVVITWSDGSQNSVFTIDTAGIYFATITNACGVSTDTIAVAAISLPPLDLGDDQSLCAGEVISIEPGIPGVDYLWQDGSTATTYSTSTGGTVILTISNACGTITDSLLITETTEGPQVDLGPDIVGCAGSTVSISAGISGVSYVWQDGSTGNEFIATASGTVILQVSNNCGTDVDTIAIDLSAIQPATDLGPDTMLCNGNSLTLQSTAPSGTAIVWQDGSNESQYILTTSGTYAIHEINACGENFDTMVVSFINSPAPFSLGPDTTLCPGESLTLYAPVTTDSIQWQDGSHTTSIVAQNEQVYTLEIFNQCGSTSDALMLSYDANIPIIDLDTMRICPGDIVQVDATQSFDATYLWSTGAVNSFIDVQIPGEYAVTVFTVCSTIAAVFPVVAGDACAPKTFFYIPNIFSPNGDQVNDVFSIQFNDEALVIGVAGDIFDRWGNHVFRSGEHPFIWDGNFNGQPMNPGVYVYRLRLTYSNGVNTVTEIITGDITLMR